MVSIMCKRRKSFKGFSLHLCTAFNVVHIVHARLRGRKLIPIKVVSCVPRVCMSVENFFPSLFFTVFWSFFKRDFLDERHTSSSHERYIVLIISLLCTWRTCAWSARLDAFEGSRVYVQHNCERGEKSGKKELHKCEDFSMLYFSEIIQSENDGNDFLRFSFYIFFILTSFHLSQAKMERRLVAFLLLLGTHFRSLATSNAWR